MISRKDAKPLSRNVGQSIPFVPLCLIFSNSILNAALLTDCAIEGFKPSMAILSIATGFIPVVRNIISHKDAKPQRWTINPICAFEAYIFKQHIKCCSFKRLHLRGF